jgi:cob(I)alamin adenosyltransferase
MKKFNNLTQKEIEKYLVDAHKDLNDAMKLLDTIEKVEDDDNLPNAVNKLEKDVESMEKMIKNKYKDIIPEESKDNLDTEK